METKQIYKTPRIEQILLDNKISLALESIPPVGPNEYSENLPCKEFSDPFNSELI